MSEKKKFIEDEAKFTGGYSKEVFDTLKQAYGKYFTTTLLLLFVGFCGRTLLLSNANLVGLWVDSLCKAPSPCKPLPPILQGLTSGDFVGLMGLATALGLLLTVLFSYFILAPQRICCQ